MRSAPGGGILRTAPLLSVVALAPACGSGLPQPPTGPHPTDAYAEVEYPPPSARVEFIPSSPRKDAVWIDGQWTRVSGKWKWQPGAWVIPPPGAYFARWATMRRANGTLLFAPPAWRGKDAREVPAPPALARAGGPPGTKTAADLDDAGGSEAVPPPGAVSVDPGDAAPAADAAVAPDAPPPEPPVVDAAPEAQPDARSSLPLFDAGPLPLPDAPDAAMKKGAR